MLLNPTRPANLHHKTATDAVKHDLMRSCSHRNAALQWLLLSALIRRPYIADGIRPDARIFFTMGSTHSTSNASSRAASKQQRVLEPRWT